MRVNKILYIQLRLEQAIFPLHLPIPTPPHQEWAKVSHHIEWASKVSSCTRDGYCSHCQVSHIHTRLQNCHPYAEGLIRSHAGSSPVRSRVCEFLRVLINSLYRFPHFDPEPLHTISPPCLRLDYGAWMSISASASIC